MISNEELKALPRKVGRMQNYEQVRALLLEGRRQLQAHQEAIARGEFCPECQTHIEREYVPCAYVSRLHDAGRVYAHRMAHLQNKPIRDAAKAYGLTVNQFIKQHFEEFLLIAQEWDRAEREETPL